MASDLHPPQVAVLEAVQRALAEDLLPLGDLSAGLLDPRRRARGAIRARDEGVVAGARCVAATFAQLDPAVSLDWVVDDGDAIHEGGLVAIVEGPLSSVLTGERTALNFLGHLSGVATLTRRFVDAVATAGTGTRLWDTRKTTPGLRALEKAAVRAGGGANHRGNLSEWVMLKDNHLLGSSIEALVGAARAAWPARPVQVECDRIEQVVAAVDAGASLVLLDNMSPRDAARCVDEVRSRGADTLIEASGGITLDNVADYARAGVDLVSTSVITISAPTLDVGLDLDDPDGEE